MRYKFEGVTAVEWDGESVQSKVSGYVTLPMALDQPPLIKCGLVNQENIGPAAVAPVIDQSRPHNEFALVAGAAEGWKPPAGTVGYLWWSAEPIPA